MSNFNINELTLDNIGQWPVVVKYGAAILIAAVVIVIGYKLFISPNFEQYDILLNEQANLKMDFEKKQHQAANLASYKQQLTVMNERFGNMLRQLPAENEMPGLLEDISKTGIASGLNFELFAPLPEVTHDFYMELPINIIVVGSYRQFAIFLSRIAEMSRIVTLHDFEIQGVSNDRQKTNAVDALEMNITAKIYRYKPQ